MAEMGQDDIDALLDNVGGEDDVGTSTTEKTASGGTLDQDNINALFDSAGSSDASDTTPSSEGEGADDMDALLAEIQDEPSFGQGGDEVDINDLLTEIQSDNPALDNTTTQSDIDALMKTVGGSIQDMPGDSEEERVNVDFLLEMKLTITFEVGRSKMLIGDLLSLGQGSVIELHRLVGEDLDMFVNGRLIAKGEVVVVSEKFGVRLLDIVSPEDRVKNMAGFDKF